MLLLDGPYVLERSNASEISFHVLAGTHVVEFFLTYSKGNGKMTPKAWADIILNHRPATEQKTEKE
jgi:hypothetical protein